MAKYRPPMWSSKLYGEPHGMWESNASLVTGPDGKPAVHVTNGRIEQLMDARLLPTCAPSGETGLGWLTCQIFLTSRAVRGAGADGRTAAPPEPMAGADDLESRPLPLRIASGNEE